MFASLFAHADCPDLSSIDRYIETTSDALVALEGAIPEEQYLELDARYAAMIVLAWNDRGLEEIDLDETAMFRLMRCYQSQSCGLEDTELPSIPEESSIADFVSGLPEAPSESMLIWAEITLECRAAPEEVEDEAELDATAATEDDVSASDPELLAANSEQDTASDNESDTAEVSVETASLETPELTAESAPRPEPVTFAKPDEDPRELVERAAIFIASGEVDKAIPPLRASCLYEANSVAPSVACDTLLDIYEARTAFGQEEIATSSYLAFSEEICGLGYNIGCQNMALYLRAANTPGAYEQGVAFTARSCDLGDAIACTTLASDHIEGRIEVPDLSIAFATTQRACDLGHAESCLNVADFYVRGVGVDPDVNQALNAAAIACPEVEASNADACVSAADFVLINMKAGNERSMQVRTFIKRACDIGHDIGCAWYAEDLELGIGGAADPQGAKQARLTACEYGDQDSCDPRS